MPSIPVSFGTDGRLLAAFVVSLVLLTSSIVGVAAGQSAGSGGDRALGTAGATCPSQNGVVASASGVQSPASSDLPVPNESSDLTVALGDLAVVPLSVPAGENVTVTVGNDTGYSARLAVQDDGDGNVTLLVNTYTVGSPGIDGSDTYRAVGNDTATVLGGRTNVTLERRSYPVTARSDGEVAAEQTVTVTGPAIGNVSAYRALPRVFGAANASAIRTAERRGQIEPLSPGDPPAVYEGETLVLAVDAPTLLGVVASRPGDTTTDRVLAVHHRRSTIPTELEIVGPCGGISLRRAAEHGKFRAISDYRAGVVYLLLDTDDLLWNYGEQSFYLDIGSESRLVDGAEMGREFEFRTNDTRLVTDDDTIRLPPTEEATFQTESVVLPGSRLSISLQYADVNDSPIVARTNTTVSANGTVTATFDLSTVSEERRYSVFVDGRQPSVEPRTPTDDGTPTATETTATDSDTVTATTARSSPSPTDSVSSSTRTERTTTRRSTPVDGTVTGPTAGSATTLTTRTTTADGPGFGIVLALAVVAAGTVLVARRR